MKNQLKKTVSILIALTVLLCAMSTFADEATETGEVNAPTFEVGSGISGTLQPDAATTVRVHAGNRGQVQFTLALTEDCGVSVTVNGGGVGLTCPDGSLPVYTFISWLEWDESKLISMTAEKEVGYSITSELLPEEPAPEAEQEENVVEEPALAVENLVEEPATEPAGEPAEGPAYDPVEEPVEEPVTEPSVEPAEEPANDSVEEPVTDPVREPADGPVNDPVGEPVKEPAAEDSAEAVSSEQNVQPEAEPGQLEPAEEGNATEPEVNPTEGSEAESADESGNASNNSSGDTEPEVESGETEQPAQSEETLEGSEAVDQPEGQSQDNEAEQQVQPEEQPEEPETEQPADEQPVQQEEQPEEPETEQPADEQLAQQEEQGGQPEAEQPSTEEQESEQSETENPEGAANSVEIIIAKSLTPEESWNGTVRNKKSTILKLDVAQAGMIHMLVEGKDVCYSVQKSDRITEDVDETLTDTETNRSITSWSAEAGSYLISIHAGENSLMARVAVSFMTDEELAALEAEQATMEEEEKGKEEEDNPGETEGETEAGLLPKNEEEEENKPESEPERSIKLSITWDEDEPDIGSTAHLVANLTGYENVVYTMQWQYSPDAEHWTDATGETGNSIDITITEENNNFYWRIVVYREEPQE